MRICSRVSAGRGILANMEQLREERVQVEYAKAPQTDKHGLDEGVAVAERLHRIRCEQPRHPTGLKECAEDALEESSREGSAPEASFAWQGERID